MQAVDEHTIVAIATPLGVGGVSIIRLSGSLAWSIAQTIFLKTPTKKQSVDLKPNYAQLGWIVNPQNNTIVDQVLLIPFKAPKSYTGEDIIEIHCHGNPHVARKIIQLCISHGATLAEPGEYTKRAFLNGRLDLTQAEAVLDMVHAKTDMFSGMAAYNLSGKIAQEIAQIKSALMHLLANIMASIDFPDEIAPLPYQDIENLLQSSKNKVTYTLATCTQSRIFKEGAKICIVGKPNVGKSSIFNRLLNKDRAIVTEIPGTTRDLLDDVIDIHGIPIILVDTAGIRDSGEIVESIGINRSRETMLQSDVILFIYDLEKGLELEDHTILQLAQASGKKLLVVGNKEDISHNTPPPLQTDVKISALSNSGFEALREALKNLLMEGHEYVAQNEGYLNLRHQECLENTLKSLELALKGVYQKTHHDLIAIDLKDALLFLGELSGELLAEDIVDTIFKNFCVGK